jgi:hypothetical protein
MHDTVHRQDPWSSRQSVRNLREERESIVIKQRSTGRTKLQVFHKHLQGLLKKAQRQSLAATMALEAVHKQARTKSDVREEV